MDLGISARLVPKVLGGISASTRLAMAAGGQDRAMPCNAMQCCAKPCNAMLCNAVLSNALLRNAVQCHAVLCCAMQWRAVPCSAMQSHTMPCCARPCCAMLCSAVQCYAMPFRCCCVSLLLGRGCERGIEQCMPCASCSAGNAALRGVPVSCTAGVLQWGWGTLQCWRYSEINRAMQPCSSPSKAMGRAGMGYGTELGGAGALHAEGAAGEAALGGKPLLLCKILQ